MEAALSVNDMSLPLRGFALWWRYFLWSAIQFLALTNA